MHEHECDRPPRIPARVVSFLPAAPDAKENLRILLAPPYGKTDERPGLGLHDQVAVSVWMTGWRYHAVFQLHDAGHHDVLVVVEQR